VALRGHRERQTEERRGAGAAYASEGLVFCTREGRPLDRFNVRRDFLRALERAGLPPVRFHDLRQTSATLMLIAGVHLKQMGARLGHADIHTTAKYSHLVRGLDGEAAERLARAIRTGESEGAAAAEAYLKSRKARAEQSSDRPGRGGSRRSSGTRGGARSGKGTRKGTGRETARLKTARRAVPNWRFGSGREDLNLRPPEPH
jgi:hypothetical protein